MLGFAAYGQGQYTVGLATSLTRDAALNLSCVKMPDQLLYSREDCLGTLVQADFPTRMHIRTSLPRELFGESLSCSGIHLINRGRVTPGSTSAQKRPNLISLGR